MTIPHSRGGRCEVCKDCERRAADAFAKARSEIEGLKRRITVVEQQNITLTRERNEARLEAEKWRQVSIDKQMEAGAKPCGHDAAYESLQAGVRAFIYHNQAERSALL